MTLRKILRIWFGTLAVGLVGMFLVNVAIMRLEGLHLISLTMLVFAGLFGWLALRGRVMLAADGRVNNWAGLIGIVFLALPITLLTGVFWYIVAINYPKEPRHELTEKLPEPDSQQEAAFLEYLRWTIDPADLSHVNARFGDITHPSPGVSYPSPSIGGLQTLFDYRQSPIKPETPPEEYRQEDLDAIADFWRFLSDCNFFVGVGYGITNLEVALQIDKNFIEHLEKQGQGDAAEKRLLLCLRGFMPKDSRSLEFEFGEFSGYSLIEQLEYLYADGALDNADEFYQILGLMTDFFAERLTNRTAKSTATFAEGLRESYYDSPRLVYSEILPPAADHFRYSPRKTEAMWMIRLSGVEASRQLLLRISLDVERTIREAEGLQMEIMRIFSIPLDSQIDTRLEELTEGTSTSLFQTNTVGKEHLYWMVYRNKIHTKLYFMQMGKLVLNLAALEILMAGEIPEVGPIDFLTNKPLQIFCDPTNSDRVIVRLPEESPLYDWQKIPEFSGIMLEVSFEMPEGESDG